MWQQQYNKCANRIPQEKKENALSPKKRQKGKKILLAL